MRVDYATFVVPGKPGSGDETRHLQRDDALGDVECLRSRSFRKAIAKALLIDFPLL
jgi:hypothetical protein